MTESSNSTLGFTVFVPVIVSPVPAETEVTVPTLSIPACLLSSFFTANVVGTWLSSAFQAVPVSRFLETISLKLITNLLVNNSLLVLTVASVACGNENSISSFAGESLNTLPLFGKTLNILLGILTARSPSLSSITG